VVNTALLFYLLGLVTGAVWRSAFVAALFALHPLHVESVVWITERKDVLSMAFWLVTFIFYAKYAKNLDKRLYLLSLAVFALGLMAKPMLVTVPVIALLFDVWPLKRVTLPFPGLMDDKRVLRCKKLLLEKVPFFVLSAVMSVVTICAQKNTVADIAEWPLRMRLANALWSTLLYVQKAIVPWNLAAYYPLDPVPYWKACLAFVVLAATVTAAVTAWSRRPYLLAGVLFYLVTLLPVIGLIQVGGQAMADRYTYIPLIGIFVAISWGAADLAERFPRVRKTMHLAALALLAFYATATYVQIGYWKDDKTLYSHSLAVTQNNAFAHNILGIAYEKEGKGALAVREYNESLRLNPDDSGTQRNLGITLNNLLAMPADALYHFEIANRLQPGNPFTHFQMAKALMNLGRMREAVAEFQKALEIEPNDPFFHNELGMALLQLNDIDAAVSQLSEALRLMPSYGQAAANLQFALGMKGGKK
jgi:tetratricopeptide (TPR) repeat protein